MMQSEDISMIEDNNTDLEQRRASLDYAKQLMTLSTGSIVLITAFIDKGFSQPTWKPLVAASLISFVISILGAVAFHTMLVIDFPIGKTKVRSEWIGLSVFLAWVGFVSGIILLTGFAIRNFLS